LKTERKLSGISNVLTGRVKMTEEVVLKQWIGDLRVQVTDLKEALQTALNLLDSAECPCCDGSGVDFDVNGDACDCEWCQDTDDLFDRYEED
jgi:predicted methyltransferase